MALQGLVYLVLLSRQKEFLLSTKIFHNRGYYLSILDKVGVMALFVRTWKYDLASEKKNHFTKQLWKGSYCFMPLDY